MQSIIKQSIISLIAITAFTMASCKKEETITPVQKVTYTVQCDQCLVYVEDDIWNAGNEQERSKSQHFNVSGKWQYSWTNTGRDSVQMRIVVAVFQKRQHVSASIKTNDGLRAEYTGQLGFDPSNTDPQDMETVVTLKLR